jgi:hypothetical protein
VSPQNDLHLWILPISSQGTAASDWTTRSTESQDLVREFDFSMVTVAHVLTRQLPDCLRLRPENEVFEIVNFDHLFSGSRFKLRRVVAALDGTGYRLHLHRCHRLLVRSAYQKAVRYCAFATDRLLLFASCASSVPGFAHDFCLFSRSLCDIQRTFLWLDASRYPA